MRPIRLPVVLLLTALTAAGTLGTASPATARTTTGSVTRVGAYSLQPSVLTKDGVRPIVVQGFSNAPSTICSFRVFRIEDGAFRLLADVSGNSLRYIDRLPAALDRGTTQIGYEVDAYTCNQEVAGYAVSPTYYPEVFDDRGFSFGTAPRTVNAASAYGGSFVQRVGGSARLGTVGHATNVAVYARTGPTGGIGRITAFGTTKTVSFYSATVRDRVLVFTTSAPTPRDTAIDLVFSKAGPKGGKVMTFDALGVLFGA